MVEVSRPSRVIERRALSSRVVEVTLEVAGEPEFRWDAGQYLTLRAAGGPGEASWLAYSIARADDGRTPARPRLAIGDGSGRELWPALVPGSELLVAGPFGSFTLRGPRSALFIGAGTGVAPLYALLEAALRLPGGGPFVLLSGARSEEEILWREELAELAAADARFRFEPTLTQAAPEFRGRRGRVQSQLAELVSALPKESAIYVCGKTPMVESTRLVLAELGVGEARISAESY